MAKREGYRRLFISIAAFLWAVIYLLGVVDNAENPYGFSWGKFFAWTVLMGGVAAVGYGITKAIGWVRKGFDQPT
jgi:hypothetical protein